MKRYLIRIELRKPFDEGVFGKLRSAMEAAGFSRDIERIREWFEFEIPTEEYLLEKEEPGEEEPEKVILQLALETATSVHENCVVTVADYGALPWDNYTKPDDVPED